MSRAIELLREKSETGRRAAIVCAVIGTAFLALTYLVAEHDDAWKAAILGGLTGATLMGAHLTYAKAKLWERVAVERQAGVVGQ